MRIAPPPLSVSRALRYTLLEGSVIGMTAGGKYGSSKGVNTYFRKGEIGISGGGAYGGK